MSYSTAEQDVDVRLAMLFHDTYKRLAPEFGYKVRRGTRKFDSNSSGGKLTIAVCGEIISKLYKGYTIEELESSERALDFGLLEKRAMEIDFSASALTKTLDRIVSDIGDEWWSVTGRDSFQEAANLLARAGCSFNLIRQILELTYRGMKSEYGE